MGIKTALKNLPITAVRHDHGLPCHAPFFDSCFHELFLAGEPAFPLLYFDKHNTELFGPVILCLSISVKDHEIDRVPDEPGIGVVVRKFREERRDLL